jgi:gliding motility associated protien GldN
MSILKSYRLAASSVLMFMGSVALAQSNSISDQAQTQNNNSGAVNDTWQPSLVKDGVYDRVPHVGAALAWQPIREVDILWKKRYWREIDTREKQNMAFRYPGDENTGGGYFIEILIDAIKKGKIKAYSTFDDRFTTPLSKDQLMDILVGKADTQYIPDPVSGAQKMVITKHDFNPDIVTKYRIKEDWIFDRNLGQMVVRIVGIAPFKDIFNDDGTYRTSAPLFWLYYPEIRPLLAQYEVFNPDNDVARMTWDDFFENRMFSSHVIKVSNPFDANYKEEGYSNMESLYKGQEAQQELFNKEQDMWVN